MGEACRVTAELPEFHLSKNVPEISTRGPVAKADHDYVLYNWPCQI